MLIDDPLPLRASKELFALWLNAAVCEKIFGWSEQTCSEKYESRFYWLQTVETLDGLLDVNVPVLIDSGSFQLIPANEVNQEPGYFPAVHINVAEETINQIFARKQLNESVLGWFPSPEIHPDLASFFILVIDWKILINQLVRGLRDDLHMEFLEGEQGVFKTFPAYQVVFGTELDLHVDLDVTDSHVQVDKVYWTAHGAVVLHRKNRGPWDADTCDFRIPVSLAKAAINGDWFAVWDYLLERDLTPEEKQIVEDVKNVLKL